MAKEAKGGTERSGEHEPHGAHGKGKRKHLLEIRTRQAEDGSLVHHHTYMSDHTKPHTIEPERQAVATSANPEEAGQHVAEQFGMNEMGAPSAPGADEQEAEPAPAE
jgi:hypothetical protein